MSVQIWLEANESFEELLLFQCDFTRPQKCCVMVSMLTLNAVDPWVLALSSRTKDNKIGKNAALRSKSRDWSSQNQNNVSEWNDISTH
jgi:hypothetical protein